MASLIDQLADLATHRDRQHADALLLQTLHESLRSTMVALHRRVGEPPEQQWQTTAHRSGVARPRASDAAASRASMSPSSLQASPGRAECLRQLHTLMPSEYPAVTLMPLVVAAQGRGVVEMRSPEPLPECARNTAEAIVRFYGNLLTLMDYGERDALTGLFNRKTFTDSFMRAVLQQPAAAQPGTPGLLYLATLDLDHFKQVNDSFGHLVGDEVLLLTARIMRSVLRTDDGLFRFGGEEFVVLLQAPHEDDAHAVLEKLRAQVARYRFPQAGHVTVSVGFTAVLPSDLPPGALDRADRALYAAKAGGRNQVVGPSMMVAAGNAAQASHGGDVELF